MIQKQRNVETEAKIIKTITSTRGHPGNTGRTIDATIGEVTEIMIITAKPPLSRPRKWA
jgi:hypothetical protein